MTHLVFQQHVPVHPNRYTKEINDDSLYIYIYMVETVRTLQPSSEEPTTTPPNGECDETTASAGGFVTQVSNQLENS